MIEQIQKLKEANIDIDLASQFAGPKTYDRGMKLGSLSSTNVW
jgi:hypothetical protein